MKVRLMFSDADFDAELPLPAHAEALAADLGIPLLLQTMAAGDEFLFTMCRAAVFQSLTDIATIDYRQQVLSDCLEHPAVVRGFYDLAVEGVQADRHIHLGLFHDRPGPKLRKARQCLVAYFAILRRLRAEIDAHAGDFSSPGLRQLCATVQEQLPYDYLDEVEGYLKLLGFPRGTLQSVRLGKTNRSTDHVLRTLEQRAGLRRFLPAQDFTRHTVTVADRDIAGMEQLNELQEWGLAVAADAVSESADHVLSFFRALRRELGFYLGAINLHHVLTEANNAACLPEVLAHGTELEAAELYDPLLPLHGQPHPVPNDVKTHGGGLLLMTGGQPGRQVDVAARTRPGPADDAVRPVRAGQILPGERGHRYLHPLQA